MKIKELKKWLNQFNGETEIFIKNSYNALGNISELNQIEKTTYGTWGEDVSCIILNSGHSLNTDIYDEEEDEYPQYIETSGKKVDNGKIIAYMCQIDSKLRIIG